MTIRISYDECQSWNAGKVLHAGPSGYSDLCVAADGNVCCLFEKGDADYRETITLARVSLDWLSSGQDASRHRSEA